MTDNVFWPLQRPEDIPKNQTNWPTFAPPQWQTFTPPLTRASDQGHLGAMFWLAVATFNGQGTEQNYTEAYRLMLIASRHGHKEAERLLAQVQAKVDITDRIDAEVAAAKWIPKPENS